MFSKEKREKRKAERLANKEKKAEEKRLERENRGTLKEQYANLWYAYKFIYKANKKLIFFRIPLLVLQSAKAVVPIFFVRAVLNELTIGRSIEKIILYASGMALATFLVKLFEYLFTRWDSREREKMNFGVQKHLAKSVTDMSYSTIENPEMQNYVWMAQYNRFDHVLQLSTAVVGSFLTVFSISAVVFTMNPLILVVILVSATVKFLVDRKQRMLPHKYNDDRVPLSRVNEYYAGLMENIDTGKEVRINNLEEWIYDKTERSWKDDLFPLDKKFTQTTLGLQGINGLISVVQDIIVYLILAFEVIYSTMTVGDFSMYLTAAGTFSNLVTGISTNYSYLMLQTAWYLKEYRHCLAIAESMKEEGNTHIDIPENVEIKFRDVSFKYPKTDRMILEHVNITIGKGETLSIVGVNGAGKTTFVKLLCRFYEPTSGEIFVNGIPARDIPLNEYYGLLGVVFQDFSLFNFTVRENIAMDTEYDEERLRDAVKKCGLESRMETLPHGADTYIYKEFDPDGIELSGGEGQKIAIARAVYRGAPIVIFDEPTSALDPIAEYDIYRNFHDLAQNRTAIYISHRLSSTRFTDKTAVFANGTIAEYGTHAELMQIENGIYRDMFSMQAKYYKE